MVKRFTVKGWNDDHIEVEDPEGKWVSYYDYAELEAQLVELEGQPATTVYEPYPGAFDGILGSNTHHSEQAVTEAMVEMEAGG